MRDVFWRQHAILRQRQRSPADLYPRYQRQHSDPPKAAVLPAADPPGRLGAATRPGHQHRPGSAGTVKQTYTSLCVSHTATVSKEVLM